MILPQYHVRFHKPVCLFQVTCITSRKCVQSSAAPALQGLTRDSTSSDDVKRHTIQCAHIPQNCPHQGSCKYRLTRPGNDVELGGLNAEDEFSTQGWAYFRHLVVGLCYNGIESDCPSVRPDVNIGCTYISGYKLL